MLNAKCSQCNYSKHEKYSYADVRRCIIGKEGVAMFRRKQNRIDTKIRQKRGYAQYLITGLAVVLMLVGGYFLFLTLAPQTQVLSASFEEWNRPVEPPKVDENRLYIPKIKLNIDYEAGGEEVLNEKAWWRYPERGDPVEGGNFILSAHRFDLGFTPGQTIRKSPFFHLNRLEEGNKVYVDFEGKRYEYTIEKRFDVKPTQVEIEEPTEEHQLTIYTCMLEGQDAGREVLVARQTGKDIDPAKELQD